MTKKTSDFQEVGRRCGSLMFRQLDFSLLASPFGRRVKSLDRGQWSTWMVEQLHRLSTSSLVELCFSPSLSARPSRSRRWERGTCERRCRRCVYVPDANIFPGSVFDLLNVIDSRGASVRREDETRHTGGVFFNLWPRCDAATEAGNNKRPRWFWSSTGPDLGGGERDNREERDHGAVIVRGAARPFTPH